MSEAMRNDDVQVVAHGGALPSDAKFWQLGIAEDAERMLEIFRSHLKPVAGRSFRLLECRPFRFRVRQSTSRCVLQYTVRLEDPGTGRQWEQWVTGLLYEAPGEAERLWRKWSADVAPAGVPEPWNALEPVCFIRELDMVVEVFPFDRRLPQLRQVLAGGLGDLESRLLARLGPGHWRAGPATFEPTRYRTEMGAVFRHEFEAREASGRSETVRCYVKVYRNDSGAETYDRLKAWSRGPRKGYSLVQAIGYWSEQRTLVLEEAPGLPLSELLRNGGEQDRAMRAAARAAAAFNQDQFGVLRFRALPDKLDQLFHAAKLLRWACPELAGAVDEITKAVVSGLREVAPGPIHGDLKPDHVFLHDNQVVFVDLDAIKYGDPVRDPAHFCSYVLGRVGLETLSMPQARALTWEFVDSYFSRVPGDWWGRFPLHCAGALIEVAGGIFRHQKPQWRERATMAVEEAQRLLSLGLR